MPGIFISYRRSDTLGWAGHLYADLCRSFGSSQVFMDYEAIPAGARFDKVLQSSLSKCDALLVLMGQSWLSCTRSDGRRRLDVADDWVRNEVASGLQRGITVVPVLLNGATMPAQADLPEALRQLSQHQCLEVSDPRWNFDMGKLVSVLAKVTPPVEEEDVAGADTGIRLLQRLIAEMPEVADAVSRSREVIEQTHRQVEKLDAFKTVHDALHTVEFECLRPMRAAGRHTRLRPFKTRFAAAMRRIEDCLHEHEFVGALGEEIMDQLEQSRSALQQAVDEPGDDSFEVALSELDTLVSGFPPRLNDGIADAAGELALERLLALMVTVRDELPGNNEAGDSALLPLFHAINAIGRLSDQLTRQTREHTRLQSLDAKLRAVCLGGSGAGRLAREWSRIKQIRCRIEPPYSRAFEMAQNDLTEIEADIDSAVDADDPAAALGLLEEYFHSMASVFREVDADLKGFCLRLGKVSEPLKGILGAC